MTHNKKPAILITRPQKSAQKLKLLLARHDFDCEVLPCMEIQPIAYNTPKISTNDVMIFTSQAAVEFYRGAFSSNVFAIGPATQLALRNKQVAASLPVDFNSESLLKVTELQQIKNKSILIVCGENPRLLLSEILQQRGAIINFIYCYRRVKPTYTAEKLQKITQKKFKCIVSNSSESLANLNALFSQQLDWLHQQQLLVSSAHMARQATELGFSKAAWTAKNTTDQAIVDVLAT